MLERYPTISPKVRYCPNMCPIRTTARPAKTPSEIFAVEVRTTRERKGWTQQQLADRLVELDCPIDRSTIAKIESGKRGISLDEAFAFAAALGVSPAALALPRGSDTDVRVAPKRTVRGYQAHRWLQGRAPLLDDNERFYNDARPDFEASAFEYSPWAHDLVKAVDALVLWLSEASHEQLWEFPDEIFKQLTSLQRDLGHQIARRHRFPGPEIGEIGNSDDGKHQA
jgi:transcriptional regulator with XRE-family HTH domain